MKYYIGEIMEINGGMEYGSEYIFDTEDDPDEYTKQVAMHWRGGDEDDYSETDDGYWSDSTLIKDYGWKEIPKEDFDVLKKYLAVL